MSHQFREFLKKVGSGQHTHKDLTRDEAASAAKMMLLQEATPAQIGAFLIAHRIKRPTGTELAGILDTYSDMGPKIPPLPSSPFPVTVLGVPYDGRDRTAPINPITALILSIAGIPVITHGGDSMPTKHGIPLIRIWQGLGLDFTHLSLTQTQQLLHDTHFTFVYTPHHFIYAQNLVPYREEIGKRPPLATIELIWSPYLGDAHIIAGFVHPATEKMIRDCFQERGQTRYTLVKGLEGSCDLRLSQTTIVAASNPNTATGFEYLKPNPSEYNLEDRDAPLESLEQLISQLKTLIEGKESPLTNAAIWNGGFYLWHCGACPDIATGINQARDYLVSGKVAAKLEEIRCHFKIGSIH